MAETAASTAYGPIVIAGLEHTLPPDRRIVDDPMAEHMLPPSMRFMVQTGQVPVLRRVWFWLLEAVSPGVYAGIVCRKRYIEDKVVESLDSSLDAVVILGAGLDTLAYRLPQLASLKVYEVDLPENVDYKRKALEAIYGRVPDQVTLVPINFEDQTLESALVQAGYSFDQRSFFVWEGVTQYLTEAAVRATFDFLAKAKPGSRLVLTYVLKDFIDGVNTYGQDGLYKRFRVRNQVWRFGMHPQAVDSFLSDYSWKLLEQVHSEDYIRRYLNPAQRTQPILEIEPAVYAEKQLG
ncbi:MAG: SAM-dependent methyltransferase [Anaerolineae bacterium]|nr:SAM-dependent methyltransferase [Anaerolineae bacterium]